MRDYVPCLTETETFDEQHSTKQPDNPSWREVKCISNNDLFLMNPCWFQVTHGFLSDSETNNSF